LQEAPIKGKKETSENYFFWRKKWKKVRKKWNYFSILIEIGESNNFAKLSDNKRLQFQPCPVHILRIYHRHIPPGGIQPRKECLR